MQKITAIFWAVLFYTASAHAQKSVPTLIEYEHLSHTINVHSLRAGSHDPSGTNDYYFTADMFSLLNSADERNLEFAKRKKINVELPTFAETVLESLKTWKADDKGGSSGKELSISGDEIRKLAARSMQEFGVGESEIAVMVEIKMYEKAKKYYFFGEDTLIAKTEYFPISQTKFEKTNDTELTLQDDKGTLVILKVSYNKPGPENKQAGK